MTSDQDAALPFELEPNEDLIEREAAGEPSIWLWVQTCPLEDCPCRSALVVVGKDREVLAAQVDLVREAWDDAEDADAFLKTLKSSEIGSTAVAFEVDIDSAEVTMPLSESETLSPEVEKVASLVDGELLDRITSLWHLGKEQPDSSTIPIEPSELKDYRVGQLLAWDEVYEGARMDVFLTEIAGEPLEAEAIDTYCVRPKCECNEVRIQFYELGEEEAGFIGTVAIKLEEPVGISLQAEDGRRPMLEALWNLYLERHPRWVPRLAHRADTMQKFGERLNSTPQSKNRKPWVSSSHKRKTNVKRLN